MSRIIYWKLWTILSIQLWKPTRLKWLGIKCYKVNSTSRQEEVEMFASFRLFYDRLRTGWFMDSTGVINFTPQVTESAVFTSPKREPIKVRFASINSSTAVMSDGWWKRLGQCPSLWTLINFHPKKHKTRRKRRKKFARHAIAKSWKIPRTTIETVTSRCETKKREKEKQTIDKAIGDVDHVDLWTCSG